MLMPRPSLQGLGLAWWRVNLGRGPTLQQEINLLVTEHVLPPKNCFLLLKKTNKQD